MLDLALVAADVDVVQLLYVGSMVVPVGAEPGRSHAATTDAPLAMQATRLRTREGWIDDVPPKDLYPIYCSILRQIPSELLEAFPGNTTSFISSFVDLLNKASLHDKVLQHKNESRCSACRSFETSLSTSLKKRWTRYSRLMP